MGKKLWNYLDGFNGILFILYSTLAFGSFVFVDTEQPLLYLLRNLFFIFLASVILCPFLTKLLREKVRPLNIQSDIVSKPPNPALLAVLAFMVSLIVFALYFIAFCPGGISGDATNQLAQTVANHYNDWHPVLHTLIFFKLPLLLTGGYIGSIIIFQNLLFSFVLSYMVFSVAKHTKGSYAVLVFLFVILNPITGNIASSPFKDNAFAMGALLLTVYLFNTFFSKGEWLRKKRNCVLLLGILVLTTLMRHNAILFTLPVLLLLLFFTTKRKFVIFSVSFLLLFSFFKLPFPYLLDVEQPDSRNLESLGLPLSVIGGVAKYDPEALDEETREFVYRLASKEEWETYYDDSGFNSLKFSETADVNHIAQVVDEAGTVNILSYMVRCFQNSPVVALRSIVTLTDPVYSLQDESTFYIIPELSEDIPYEGNATLAALLTKYQNIVGFLFPFLFLNLGLITYLLVLTTLTRCPLNSKAGLKKAAIILPTLLYNFGTMLLLTGRFDCTRFFYYTFLTTPLLLIMLLSNQEIVKTER